MIFDTNILIMNKVEEITQWLTGDQDFETGRILYDKYGKSPSQKRIYAVSGASKKNLSSLVYELQKLIRFDKPVSAAPKVKAEEPKKKKPNTRQAKKQREQQDKQQQSPKPVKSSGKTPRKSTA